MHLVYKQEEWLASCRTGPFKLIGSRLTTYNELMQSRKLWQTETWGCHSNFAATVTMLREKLWRNEFPFEFLAWPKKIQLVLSKLTENVWKWVNLTNESTFGNNDGIVVIHMEKNVDFKRVFQTRPILELRT